MYPFTGINIYPHLSANSSSSIFGYLQPVPEFSFEVMRHWKGAFAMEKCFSPRCHTPFLHPFLARFVLIDGRLASNPGPPHKRAWYTLFAHVLDFFDDWSCNGLCLCFYDKLAHVPKQCVPSPYLDKDWVLG